MELLAELRGAIAAAGDPQRAPGQQAYMKSSMPFRGVAKPQLQRLVREILTQHRLGSRQEWERAIRALWDDAGYREERYAALYLIQHRYYRDWAGAPDSLPLYEHLVRTGQWWDLCDELAAFPVGGLVRAHPQLVEVMRSWATDDDLWVRRVAVLCQLRSKEHTDTALLADAIGANATDSSFWLRKAIGWALREYAKTDPAWVVDFCAMTTLSPLSRKEALRRLEP